MAEIEESLSFIMHEVGTGETSAADNNESDSFNRSFLLVYSLNCSQTFILYSDAFVLTDIIFLYLIFSPLIPIVYQKAKRSYEKNRSAFKDARVSNVNAFVRQEDDQGIVNAEEVGLCLLGTGYMMCLECSMICRPGGIRYRTEKILSWSLASSVKGVFGP
ncbi:hypothetical protein RHGRI_011587 [Rhododendron griersonianum]|uniref:Uncharacterized protein n=1 Tax=Rhododendron griersonianum TaxID=479676 RepID=A0AAV6KNF2_9ERIC|nr:hypothetical protein RHGRI_011587 [Rhododendron griersonianum]